MLRAGAMVMERLLLVERCEGDVESVTVTIAVNGPDTLGVPVMAPEAESILRPAGRLVADQV